MGIHWRFAPTLDDYIVHDHTCIHHLQHSLETADSDIPLRTGSRLLYEVWDAEKLFSWATKYQFSGPLKPEKPLRKQPNMLQVMERKHTSVYWELHNATRQSVRGDLFLVSNTDLLSASNTSVLQWEDSNSKMEPVESRYCSPIWKTLLPLIHRKMLGL
jgi:hypothetical protein